MRVQMDGSDAVLCSANSTLPVSGVETCPTGSTCAALPGAYVAAAIDKPLADTFLNGGAPAWLGSRGQGGAEVGARRVAARASHREWLLSHPAAIPQHKRVLCLVPTAAKGPQGVRAPDGRYAAGMLRACQHHLHPGTLPSVRASALLKASPMHAALKTPQAPCCAGARKALACCCPARLWCPPGRRC